MKYFLCILTILIPLSTNAFTARKPKLSYVDSSFATLGFGLGMASITRDEGVDGGYGIDFRLSLGHQFYSFLELEFTYQYANIGLTSPDPVLIGGTVDSRLNMNQEVLQLIFSYPAKYIQPYIQGGFGAYNFFAEGRHTALDFNTNWVFPVGAGIRTYFLKDTLAADILFNYQFLRGENQSPDRLLLLGIPKVSFDTYSITATVVYHFL